MKAINLLSLSCLTLLIIGGCRETHNRVPPNSHTSDDIAIIESDAAILDARFIYDHQTNLINCEFDLKCESDRVTIKLDFQNKTCEVTSDGFSLRPDDSLSITARKGLLNFCEKTLDEIETAVEKRGCAHDGEIESMARWRKIRDMLKEV